jgi:hypothetical protein
LNLGHMTSQNLGFVHSGGSGISFGEETMTETNLLEIRRQHPQEVTLISFSKIQESRRTGADWEWHIVGKVHTLKMRVQAKRIYKAGGIGNLLQKGKMAEKPQIDQLIDDAKTNNLMPVYCFYCSEQQRKIWTVNPAVNGLIEYETGCLLLDATKVSRSALPKKLDQLERDCVPWHFLCIPRKFEYVRQNLPSFRGLHYTESHFEKMEDLKTDVEQNPSFPTIAKLNEGIEKHESYSGLHNTLERTFSISDGQKYPERGISNLLVIDVRPK